MKIESREITFPQLSELNGDDQIINNDIQTNSNNGAIMNSIPKITHNSRNQKKYEEKLIFVILMISQWASMIVHLVTVLEILFKRQRKHKRVVPIRTSSNIKPVENTHNSVRTNRSTNIDPFEMTFTDDDNDSSNDKLIPHRNSTKKRKITSNNLTPHKKIRTQ